MEISKLKEILKDFNSSIKFEHDLRKKNWFNIGGKSKIFYQLQGQCRHGARLLSSDCFSAKCGMDTERNRHG